MVVAMGHRWFGSKAASGLWQALVALMPPHAVYIETHLGGGAVMKRKPGALRNIGIDLDARALASFQCDYPVELVHADCHAYLGQRVLAGDEPSPGGDREGLVQLRAGPGALGLVRGAGLHPSADGQAQGGQLGPALPGHAGGGAPGGAVGHHGGGGAAVRGLARHLERLRACFAQLPDPLK